MICDATNIDGSGFRGTGGGCGTTFQEIQQRSPMSVNPPERSGGTRCAVPVEEPLDELRRIIATKIREARKYERLCKELFPGERASFGWFCVQRALIDLGKTISSNPPVRGTGGNRDNNYG